MIPEATKWYNTYMRKKLVAYVAECLDIDPNDPDRYALVEDVYASYLGWCHMVGIEKPYNKIVLGRELSKLLPIGVSRVAKIDDKTKRILRYTTIKE